MRTQIEVGKSMSVRASRCPFSDWEYGFRNVLIVPDDDEGNRDVSAVEVPGVSPGCIYASQRGHLAHAERGEPSSRQLWTHGSSRECP